MRVLVACEYSGRVRDAFIKRGHDAMSCDLLPSEEPGPHYKGNVLDIIEDGWDLMIAHPPCTYLTNAAEWAYLDTQKKKIKPETLIGAARREAREEAIKFVKVLAEANIKSIAIENPVGVLSTRWRKPDQFIQPYEYGDDASKKTCLWLKGLHPLRPTAFIDPRLVCCGVEVLNNDKYGCPNCNGEKVARPRWGNQCDSGQNKLAPSHDRWKERSRTYQGIADAMADQWGEVK